jgi:hypothetical protein
MNYVLTTLKAEIQSLKRYIEHCKERSESTNLEPSTAKRLRQELLASRRQIQQFRDAINVLTAYKKVKDK